MGINDVKERIIKIVVDYFDIPIDICMLNLNSEFTGSLFGFDFIDLVYLCHIIESDFDIQFTNNDYHANRFNTINNVVFRVTEKLAHNISTR